MDIPEARECSRCDGTQHLVGSGNDMGKYECDTCGMVVGFDLQSDPAEFIINRGTAARYTKERFGGILTESEIVLREPANEAA